MANSKKAGGSSTTHPPNQTLYVSNLPDKLPKKDLRMALYCLFSTYGPVIDIVALKTMKMRGQAHIAFRDLQASSQALRALQDFDFFGKPLKIAYARGKTDTIAMLDGTFKMPAPTVSSAAAAQTTLQQAVFGGGTSNIGGNTDQPAALDVSGPSKSDAAPSPQGLKRPREEDSEAEDVPMDEDDQDSDAPMEEDSSSDSEKD